MAGVLVTGGSVAGRRGLLLHSKHLSHTSPPLFCCSSHGSTNWPDCRQDCPDAITMWTPTWASAWPDAAAQPACRRSSGRT